MNTQLESEGRYEVQLETDGSCHSSTDSLEQAKLFARSLANWNQGARVIDRTTGSIVLRVKPYNDSGPKGGAV